MTKHIIIFAFLLIVPASCWSQSNALTKSFSQAQKEYKIIQNKDFQKLECGDLINEGKMQEFFRKFPDYQGKVQIVSIPNCYGAPSEKFFVLVYEPYGKVKVPKSISNGK